MSAERAVDADAFLARGRRVLASQPFSVLLGAELSALEPGRCELALTITGPLKQHIRFAHGGVVSYADGVEKICAFAQGTIARLGDAPASGDGTDVEAAAGHAQ